jgi:DMSO/TMAO reductase YedYZ molybdopterin-dependent catalytic subunit
MRAIRALSEALMETEVCTPFFTPTDTKVSTIPSSNCFTLASGLSISLDIRNLTTRFSVHEQITRLVCVEGWSAVAWWAGLRFDDLLRAYPPMSQAKWARVESWVNLDASGNPDPYFMSLDLATAGHPQTLLATHLNGQPLTADHGAPLRLLVPVKLGLKNVKAITRITYVGEQPRDYWAERGYSRHDGI